MKKTTIIILLIITFFILFYLQANIFQIFTIAGVKPNVFVLFILFVGLSTNSTLGISLGVIGGLIIDLVYSKTIGITAVMLCLVGYLGAYFDRNFSKENKITIIIMSALVTILYEARLLYFEFCYCWFRIGIVLFCENIVIRSFV